MFNVWLYTLASVIIISLVSLLGLFAFRIRKERLRNLLLYFVSFSAGAMIGDVFIHLIPQTIGSSGMFTLRSGLFVLCGIVAFFIIEKFICWRHCHVHDGVEHPFVWTNLIGDSVHNFIDGLIIGASYLVSFPVGIASSIAVFFHEIPQEIGDFGVLIHGGFSRGRALFFNFVTALTAVLGAIVVLAFGSAGGLLEFLIPFAAGTFIYIAGTDLIPELHKEARPIKSFMQLLYFIFGILVMLSLLLLE